MQNCASAAEKNKEAGDLVKEWAGRFYDLLSHWRFLPNSPTLMNAGRDLQQLSACYVLPVEDSMEGITHALQAQALIHKSGGGTGFSFERLRPAGDAVKSTAGVASGVISFMQVFDKLTDVVKQGGNRRGANMGILPYWHPEIKEFIKIKSQPGMLENFNISVSLDATFFEAVKNQGDYDLLNPRTKEPVGRQSATEIFDLIVEQAWKTGDPGVVFIDEINRSSSNPTPALGRIEATNPCGEQPLLANEPCNLGSINLSLFVKEDQPEPSVDFDALKETVRLAVRFLDNVIDVNNYPLPEIEYMAKGNRRIGLGIMGWAEMLVKMGFPYDSEQAIRLAEEVMGGITKSAMEASEELARTRGTFPNWKKSVYDPESSFFSGEARHPRHCARTTIAPTGTIALAAGLQGAGIEPFFAIAYTRYNAAALDALKKGIAPDPRDVFFEVNPHFKKIAEKHRYFGLSEKKLWERIEKNHKSVKGLPEIPENIQALFRTSHDISISAHVNMQAAFQRHTDNAVSKTINMSQEATAQDVKKAYVLAYESGCKGITIYRDGSKQQQVLNLLPAETRAKKARDLSIGVSSEYYEIKTGHGPLHVHINYDDAGPFRMFVSIAPLGTEIAGLASITGILLSKYLEEGGDPTRILKHLQSVKGDRPLGLGENRVNSIPHGIALALRTHLKKHGWIDDGREKTEDVVKKSSPPPASRLELWNLSQAADQCPECFSSNISFSAGCSGPLCHDCGYSECA